MSSSLLQEAITETHSQSKCRVVEFRLNGYIYKILLLLRFREHLRTWDQKMVRAWESRSWLWDRLLVMSEVTVMKPHQRGCLNTSWTRMTTIHIQSSSVDRKPRGLYPTQQTIHKQGMPRVGAIVFSREEGTNWSSNIKWLFLKIYTLMIL